MGALRWSVEALEKDSRIFSLEVASVYETSPWGSVTGGSFLNTVAAGRWLGGDRDLLELCRDIEKQAGSPVKKNGKARRLDIDVLFLEDAVSSPEMTLPHPGIPLRRFVLVPLSEVWGGMIPGLGRTALELLQSVDDESSIIFRGSLKAD